MSPLLLLACTGLEKVPPQVSAQMPETAVRGELVVEIRASDEGAGLAVIEVQLDDGPPVALPAGQTTWTVDTRTLSQGEHRVRVRVVDAAWAQNEASVESTFRCDNQPPQLLIASRSLQGSQGHTWPIALKSDEDLAEGVLRFGELEHALHPLGDGVYRVVLGFDAEHDVGPSSFEVEVADALGNRAVHTVPVDIQATDFPVRGYIRLSKAQKKERKNSPAVEEMKQQRGDAFSVEIDEQLWSGPMRVPVEGRKTSAYGAFRQYSDGARSYHRGTDIANASGTPVAAAAAGRVTFAGDQAIFGKVVIVHHGLGVSTSYNHLSRIDVAEGDTLDAGAPLGLLGSTGQSTGPHLHWGLMVGASAAVDALEWLEDDFSAFSDWIELPPERP